MATVRFLNDDLTVEDMFLKDQVFVDVQIVEYSFNEEATPLAPGDSSGATSQFMVRAILQPRTDLALDSIMEINLDSGEQLLGIVSGIDIDGASNNVILTLDGLMNRFNVEVDMPPQLNVRFDVAVRAWAALVKIGPALVEVDSRIAGRIVSWPGSKGINLWDAIKQMCAAYGYEAYSTGSKVGFRMPGEIELFLTESATTKKVISRSQRVATVTLKAYHSVPAVDSLLYKSTEVFQVDAGDTMETSVAIEGSVLDLVDPVPVNAIDLTGITGQYVITGSDGYIIDPVLWTDFGGRVEVAVGEDYNEIKLTIVGAALPSRSPFRVSEGAADRPALRVAGNGLLHTPEDILLLTGDEQASTVGTPPEVDNIFITETTQAWDRGAHTAQYYGNPEMVLSINDTPNIRLVRTVDDGTPEELTSWFGYLAGAMVRYNDAMYRVTVANYRPHQVDLTLTEYTLISEFNEVWEGMTFADFETAIGPDLTFAQHSVRPLTEATL